MKKVLCLLMVAIICLSVTSCTIDQTSVENENVVLSIGLPNGSTITPWEIVDGFKASHPNITLDIDETPWSEYKTKLKLQLTGKNAPDIFLMDSGFVMEMGMNGVLANLADRVEKDLNKDEYTSGLFAGLDPQGCLWGIPHALNVTAVYYNKTMFDEAGVPYPKDDWTFDDMFETAKKLTKKDPSGNVRADKYGIGLHTGSSTGWIPFVTAMGGAPLDETRTKSMFADPKTVEGMKKLIDAINDPSMHPSFEWLSSMGGHATLFYKGQLGMYFEQSSFATAIKTNASEDFDYDVAPVPVGWDGNRHVSYVPNFLAISNTASKTNQDAAWEFIKYYLNKESQMAIANTLLAGIPIRKSALDYIAHKEDVVPANFGAFYKYLDENSETMFENKTYGEWMPKVTDKLNQIRKGVLPFDKGMQEIEKEVSLILENE